MTAILFCSVLFCNRPKAENAEGEEVVHEEELKAAGSKLSWPGSDREHVADCYGIAAICGVTEGLSMERLLTTSEFCPSQNLVQIQFWLGQNFSEIRTGLNLESMASVVVSSGPSGSQVDSSLDLRCLLM